MLDPGIVFEAAQGLLARRQGNSEERQEGDEERQSETAEKDAMRKRREQAPQLEQRHDEESQNDEEGPKQRLPHPLAEKRKPTQPHPPVEALRKRVLFRRFGGRRLLSRTGTHHLHLARSAGATS